MPKNSTSLPASHAVRIRGVLSSARERLASSRSVEITGFTLIELLIVMAIISVLSTIGFYQYSSFIQRTKVTKAIADVKEIARLIDDFQERNGRYPASLDDLERGPFRDPWGNLYQYVNISEDDKKGADKQKARRDRNQKPINTYYDLWSNGADGDYQQQVNGAKSRDDIICAWDGSFVGLGKDLDELYGKPRAWKHPADDTPDDTTPPTTTPPSDDKGKGKDKDTEPPTTTTTTTPTTAEPTTVPPTTEEDKGKGGGKK
jgi:prepilin-type N-terminal cleavage/methylation domain-containing protein